MNLSRIFPKDRYRIVHDGTTAFPYRTQRKGWFDWVFFGGYYNTIEDAERDIQRIREVKERRGVVKYVE